MDATWTVFNTRLECKQPERWVTKSNSMYNTQCSHNISVY